MSMFDDTTYRFNTVTMRRFRDVAQQVEHAFECDANGFVDRDKLHPERAELYDDLLVRVASGHIVDLGVSRDTRLQADPPPNKRPRRRKARQTPDDEVAQLPKRYTPAEIKANLGPGVYLRYSDMTVWDEPDEGGPDLYIFVPELAPEDF